MEHTLALLGEYGYLLLFPLAIVEGPIITVLAGFLVTLGVLNPFIVYAIVVAGDMVGDSWLYGVGRVGGKWLDRVSRFFRVTPEKLEQAKGFFDTHHHRTLILSKLVHGIGAAGLIAAGMLRIPYRRYVFVCVLISLAQSCIFLLIGILFGHLYAQIKEYLDLYAVVVSIAVLVIAGGSIYRVRKSNHV